MKIKFFIVIAACAILFAFSTLALAQGKCTEPGSIKSVTKSRAGNFEYVTFEVLSADPHYAVTNAKRPFQMYGDDKTIRIKGNFFKSIVFRDVFWTCEIAEKFSTPTSTIMAVKSIEQFEGQVEYIIGYRTRSKFVSHYMTGTGSSRKVVLKFKR